MVHRGHLLLVWCHTWHILTLPASNHAALTRVLICQVGCWSALTTCCLDQESHKPQASLGLSLDLCHPLLGTGCSPLWLEVALNISLVLSWMWLWLGYLSFFTARSKPTFSSCQVVIWAQPSCHWIDSSSIVFSGPASCSRGWLQLEQHTSAHPE